MFGNVLGAASLKLKCVLLAFRFWGRSKGVGWILKRLTSCSPILMALCGVFPVTFWVWYSIAALFCCINSGSLRST